MSDTGRGTGAADVGTRLEDGGGRGRPRWMRTWAFAFAILFGLAACWSVATPLFASVDEPAHVLRAASVAHGQSVGAPCSRQSTTSACRPDHAARGPWTLVRVPAGIAHEVGDGPTCYPFHPDVSAGCASVPSPGGARGTALMPTYVGRYPPLYYAVVGIPSLFTSRTVVLYLMRLVSGALSAAFLAAAFSAARHSRRFLLAPLGVGLAVTPMALFLSGVVNPSGLEISTAICAWSTALTLAGDPELHRSRFLIVWLALSAGVLVQTRGLSPVFLAAVVAGVALLFGVRPWRRAWDTVVARAGLAFVVICSAFALAWYVLVHPTRVTPQASGPVHEHGLALLAASYHHLLWMVPQMVGFFGWLDAPAPQLTYHIWYAALIFFGVLVVARRWYRGVGVWALLAAATVAVPVAATAHVANRLGLIGQGRDWLPLAVSLPLVGAYAARRLVPPGRSGGAHRGRSGGAVILARLWRYAAAALSAAAMAALGVAEMGGFLRALHRYRDGLGHPTHLFGHASWTPPLPPGIVIVAAAALTLAWCAWVAGAVARGLVLAGNECGREDSNLHPFRDQDLNLARLPLSPRPREPLS